MRFSVLPVGEALFLVLCQHLQYFQVLLPLAVSSASHAHIFNWLIFSWMLYLQISGILPVERCSPQSLALWSLAVLSSLNFWLQALHAETGLCWVLLSVHGLKVSLCSKLGWLLGTPLLLPFFQGSLSFVPRWLVISRAMILYILSIFTLVFRVEGKSGSCYSMLICGWVWDYFGTYLLICIIFISLKNSRCYLKLLNKGF